MFWYYLFFNNISCIAQGSKFVKKQFFDIQSAIMQLKTIIIYLYPILLSHLCTSYRPEEFVNFGYWPVYSGIAWSLYIFIYTFFLFRTNQSLIGQRGITLIFDAADQLEQVEMSCSHRVVPWVQWKKCHIPEIRTNYYCGENYAFFRHINTNKSFN